MSMTAITEGQMRFAAGIVNYVEYNFAVLPPDISPNQIRKLADVAPLGGKVLATSVQGFPVPPNPQTESPSK